MSPETDSPTAFAMWGGNLARTRGCSLSMQLALASTCVCGTEGQPTTWKRRQPALKDPICGLLDLVKVSSATLERFSVEGPHTLDQLAKRHYPISDVIGHPPGQDALHHLHV